MSTLKLALELAGAPNWRWLFSFYLLSILLSTCHEWHKTAYLRNSLLYFTSNWASTAPTYDCLFGDAHSFFCSNKTNCWDSPVISTQITRRADSQQLVLREKKYEWNRWWNEEETKRKGIIASRVHSVSPLKQAVLLEANEPNDFLSSWGLALLGDHSKIGLYKMGPQKLDACYCTQLFYLFLFFSFSNKKRRIWSL